VTAGRPGPDEPVLELPSRERWREWLAERQADSDGVWLKLAKAGKGAVTVSQADAVDVALCFGWIDGRAAPLDDCFWLQRFTPRRARSRWSKRNRARAEALIRNGEMAPAGLREVERARADGRWDAAYDSPATATVPDDLQRALDENPAARDFFASLDRSNRYAVLYRIQEARRPETRARRIGTLVAMLGEGRKLHP
jgi:uncharacterized protein YdeI (YjbR/CyaY-like superfamily)